MNINFRCSREEVVWTILAVPVVVLALVLTSCGTQETQYDTNLLKNPSFEDVENGIPKHWTLASFRGLEGQSEVIYGIDDETAAHDQKSWSFTGDPGTRRWFILKQEVEVRDVSHVRLQGWIQTREVIREFDQYPQSNFVVNFYDENKNRFQELRFWDKRTRPETGTLPWVEKDLILRLPKGTRYVSVGCILGSSGTVWFDNVRLSVPKPLDWETQATKNFVFYSLPERPFPPGSIENQQLLLDGYAGRLGIETDIEIFYYLYPDTASIRRELSIKGFDYVSHQDREIHTINPNENHEIIHILTDPYGLPPRAIYEGTVFWLHGNWRGEPIHEAAARILATPPGLPPMALLVNDEQRAKIDANIWIPTAASFVGYLANRWGPERLMELYKTNSARTSYEYFDGEFQKVYGITCDGAQADWQSVLKDPKSREKLQ